MMKQQHQITHKKQKREIARFLSFVIPERFERSTHALEGRCSIQLSYGTIKSLRTAKIEVFLQFHKRNNKNYHCYPVKKHPTSIIQN